MTKPLITIGVTAYNAAHTVERAIESALSQSWVPLEIIVVDDASTDTTPEILARLADEHTNIRTIRHEENQGVAAARNTIISHARGEAIAFFDDDDVSHPERIVRQWHRLTTYERQHGHGFPILCYTGRKQVFPNGSTALHPGRGSSTERVGAHGSRLVSALLWGRPLPAAQQGTAGAGTQMGRTETFHELGGFDPRFRRAEDMDLDVRVARAKGHTIGVADPLVTQYLTPAVDRSIDAQEQASRLLLQKHAEAFPSRSLLAAALRWTQARFALRRGQKREALHLIWSALLLQPAFTLRRVAQYLLAAPRSRTARKGIKAAFASSPTRHLGASSSPYEEPCPGPPRSSKPQILLLIDHLPHYRAGFINGLAEKYDLTVASIPGYSATVPEMAPGREQRLDLRLRRLGPLEFFVGSMAAAARIEYDVLAVFANARWPHVWFTTAIARLRRRTVVHWGHGWTGRENRAIGSLRRSLHATAHATFVFGAGARDLAIRRYGADPTNIHVIWNSLPWTDHPAPLATPPSGDAMVLLVSRLVPERRVDLLIAAIAELKARGKRTQAIIVGEGPTRGAAERLAGNLGVSDRVRLVGACYDEEALRQHYSEASLAVIPGKVGLAAVAAAGYGLPIVCSSESKRHAPEVELVVDGKTGVLFHSDEPAAIADAIEIGLDPDLWKRMSDEAMTVVRERYSPSAQLRIFSGVVDDLLAVDR